ncbi:MAG: GNAT family N-acetyltransferase [Solirubrobacteraceae bacterium]
MAQGEAEVNLLLTAERAGLGPLRTDLVDLYARWWNDREVRRGLATIDIWTIEAAEKWVAEAGAASARPQPTAAHFTVYATPDAVPVGTLALMEIDHQNRRAEFGILIGERRGEGIGTAATRLALEWAFEVIGLENVLLGVLPSNLAGIRAYERAGFRPIGRRRNAATSSGRREDELLMDAVAADFRREAATGADG